MSKYRPIIKNIVATADLHQTVEPKKFSKFSWGIYYPEIYNGKCGYIKTKEMEGKVTIFSSGKMISIGAKSISSAIRQLDMAKLCLVKNKFVSDVKLESKIQNMVSVLSLPFSAPIEKLANSRGVYEPEQFPALILKGTKSVCFMIFASGKIIINGTKSVEELNSASFEIQKLITENRSVENKTNTV